MQPQDTALRLVGRIYDAAEKPEVWPVFLKEVASELRSTVATIVTHDLTSLHGTLSVVHGADPETIKAYDSQYGSENIYVQRAAGRIAPGTVVHGGMLCTDQEVLRSDFYNGILKRNDWFYLAGGAVAMEKELVSLFSVMRSRRAGQYSEQDLVLLRLLMPHLKRAVRMHQRLQVLQAGIEAVDSLTVGIITVNTSGKVLLANGYARTVLKKRDGLFQDRDGTLATTQRQKPTLAGTIARVAETSNGRSLYAGASLVLERPSGKPPYHLWVSPTHSTLLLPNSERPTALIFVKDPEIDPKLSVETLIQSFRLTPAEARLTDLLARGNSLGHACEKLAIRYTTGRAHLRAIFGKLGVSRQSELVALVHRATAL